jgi:hypothetical protein
MKIGTIIFSLLITLSGLAETVVSYIRPTSPLDTYPVTVSQYQKGGFMTWITNVSQLTDTTSAGIPTARRADGMVVSFGSSKHWYRLSSDLVTWTQTDPVITFANVDDLVAIHPAAFPTNTVFRTSGRWNPGDGGGSDYWYSSSSASTTNYGTIFNCADAGQLLWVGGENINVRMFGAKADFDRSAQTGTDNSVYFNNIISALTYTNVALYGNQPAIFIPKGFYLIGNEWRTYTSAHTNSGGDYVRGTMNIVGENQNSTVLVFGGTTNCGVIAGNGGWSISQLTIDSTTARATNSVSANYEGVGLLIFDPVDGTSAGFNITDVWIRNQPGYGYVHSAYAEDVVNINMRVQTCNFGRAVGAGGGGIGFVTDFGQPPFNSTYIQTRSELNRGPGAVAEAITGVQFIGLKLLNNASIYQGLFTNSINNIFNNCDIEHFQAAACIKVDPTNGFSFTSTVMTNPNLDFIALGFVTNRVLVVTNSTASDGVYEILGVTTHTVTVSNGIQGFNVGLDLNTLGVQCSDNGIGLYFNGGYGDQIIGGVFSSVAAGIVHRTPRDGFYTQNRIANYDAALPDMPFGIWLVGSSGFNFGNFVKLYETDQPNVVSKIGGRSLSSCTNLIYQGSRTIYKQHYDAAVQFNDIVTLGETADGRVLSIQGGAGGVPQVRWSRTGFDTIDTSITTSGWYISNATQSETIGVFAATTTDGQWTMGPVSSATPKTKYLRSTQGVGTDINGAAIVIRPGEQTGAGLPSTVRYELTGTGATGTTVRTPTFLFGLGQPVTPALGDTVVTNSYYNGSSWITGPQTRDTSGALVLAPYVGTPMNDSTIVLQTYGSGIQSGGPPGITWTMATSSATITTNQARWVTMVVPRTDTYTGLAFWIAVQGVFTPAGTNCVALFSGTAGTLTKVAESANDSTIFTQAAGTLVKVPFSTPVSLLAHQVVKAFILRNASAEVTATTVAAPVTQPATTHSSLDFPSSIKLIGTTSLYVAPTTQAESGINVGNTSPYVMLYK